MRNVFLLTSFFLLFAFGAKTEINDFEQCFQTKAVLDSTLISSYYKRHPVAANQEKRVQQLYAAHQNSLLWTKSGSVLPHAVRFMELISKLPEHGILVSEASQIEIERAYRRIADEGEENADERLLSFFDLALSSAFFEYMPQLWQGMLNPHDEDDIEWNISWSDVSYEDVFNSIRAGHGENLLQARKFHDQYFQLQKTLSRYQKIAAGGGWPKVASDSLLKKGDKTAAVHALAERLAASGDLKRAAIRKKFNRRLEKAVIAFQKRHGLKPDGIVGGETLAALNVPVEERINQIIINMERWRWMPPLNDTAYLLVNIPEYRLRIFESEKLVREMRVVVVGKNRLQTVVFEDTLKTVVFNPYWKIPSSIATEEILPKIRKDPSYIKKQRIEVGTDWEFDTIDQDTINWENVPADSFPYTVRQKPGKENPLGRVKFLFPNHYAIYLHDTPAKGLFEEKERHFSHGCIRVEKPKALARYLLKPSVDKGTINKYLKKLKEEKEVDLQEPLPVYLAYFTVWVDDENQVHFRNDIYGHDKALEKILVKKLNNR